MMKSARFGFFFCLMVVMLSSCSSSSPKAPLSHFAQNVMTIDYHITVGDPLTISQREQVQQIIEATFQEVDVIYNKWNPHSELSQLNAFPAHTPFSLSPQLNQFLLRVDALVRLSKGRFDPTIEPMQQLWKTKLEQGQCPTTQEIEALKPCIGWETLHIAHGVVYKNDGRTQLDLGGVAKGYCVDLLIERLHQIGLNSLYVEWGGEIRTLGFHPSQRPWRVFISRLANPDPAQALAQID
jgi:thiamine biosynthesis lipoprotein